MSRLSFGLVLLVGILAGGLGVSLLNRGPAPVNDATVRGIVAEMLSADAGKSVDPAQLNGLIEDYLMDDPAILDRMAAKLSVAKREAQKREQLALLKANYTAIYEDPANVVLGNPNGDVTLVEMFDYNCGYCRRALPDIAALERFIVEQLSPIPGLEKIRSSFALKQVRYKTALPLPQSSP